MHNFNYIFQKEKYLSIPFGTLSIWVPTTITGQFGASAWMVSIHGRNVWTSSGPLLMSNTTCKEDNLGFFCYFMLIMYWLSLKRSISFDWGIVIWQTPCASSYHAREDVIKVSSLIWLIKTVGLQCLSKVLGIYMKMHINSPVLTVIWTCCKIIFFGMKATISYISYMFHSLLGKMEDSKLCLEIVCTWRVGALYQYQYAKCSKNWV